MKRIEDSMKVIKDIYTDFSEQYMEQLKNGQPNDLGTEHIIDCLASAWEYLNGLLEKNKTT